MALKRFYDNQDDIPEALRDAYVERDGKYVLDAEASDGEKNAEDVRKALAARDNEKSNYAKLAKEFEAFKAQLGGIDPARLPDAIDALSKVDDLEHQRLLDEKKFEEAAEQKYKRKMAEMMRQMETVEQSVSEWKSKYDTAINRLRTEAVTKTLTQLMNENGANPKMTPFIINELEKTWELDENLNLAPIALSSDGEKMTAYGADGKPLTPREQVVTFLKETPWAVLESRGTGSSHQSNGANGNGQVSITREEARDVNVYARRKEQAEKAGQELVIMNN